MNANVIVNTLNINKSEWLQWRKNGLGGSDAGAVAGVNPWKSPLSVYLEKIGEIEEQEDNEKMRQGRDFEDYVASRFTEETGLKVRRKNAILQHPKYEFMLANIDRWIVGKNEGLEIKTTSPFNTKDWDDDKIPPYYELQCHHYMAVTGADSWWIAVLILNTAFVYKKIERDEEIINYLIKIEKNFWENHVLKNQMPAPDGSEDAQNLINDKYSNSAVGSQITIEDNSFKDKAKRMDEVQKLIKELEKEKDTLKQEIQLRMGESEKAIIGDHVANWKGITSNRFNSKQFKKDYPDLYKEYVNQTSYRRFTLK